MRSIEIKTAHNIVLDFGLASLMQRILAFGLDLLFQYIISLVLALIIGSISSSDTAFFLIAPIWIFYHLFFEIFNNGQSLGKKIVKIKVVSISGRSVSLKSSIIRWAFRLIDILFSSGFLAMISIFSSEKSQRIGDLLADTTVISLSENNYTGLSAISKLDQLSYEVKFPGVVIYNDEDMLLLKHTLQRLKNSPNTATQSFSVTLAKKIKSDLNLPNQKIGTVKFLKRILQDYIMITR